MRNLFQVERLILPSPFPLSIQNFCDLAITVTIQKCVDFGYHVRLRLSNLRNWQRLGDCETSGGAPAETHMNLNHFPID